MLIIIKKVNKAPWAFKGDDIFQGNKNVGGLSGICVRSLRSHKILNRNKLRRMALQA